VSHVSASKRRFVGYAFIHSRRAGGLLTLGLLLNAPLPIRLPLL
jgi:hypothetical protein